jgi:hypothetical protein
MIFSNNDGALLIETLKQRRAHPIALLLHLQERQSDRLVFMDLQCSATPEVRVKVRTLGNWELFKTIERQGHYVVFRGHIDFQKPGGAPVDWWETSQLRDAYMPTAYGLITAAGKWPPSQNSQGASWECCCFCRRVSLRPPSLFRRAPPTEQCGNEQQNAAHGQEDT